MNAILGITRPGDFGGDMMHFNVHKTFTGPHGAGGPGAGPVAVRDFLADYLPGPVVVARRAIGGRPALPSREPGQIDRPHAHVFRQRRAFCCAATCTSARSARPDLKAVSTNAVLNANYLMAKLKDVLPVPHGKRCMHEFVASARALQHERGISAMDIAKRLLDYGFHAPTVYFPLVVPEAMMIEPTETESKETLDAFADAMHRIVAEDPEFLHRAPHSTAISRPDDVQAARKPILKWEPAAS